MKRQAGRETTSPSRAAAKRVRERERRDELPPPPPPPLALLLAESRGYSHHNHHHHHRRRRSRSREREKPRLREERAAAAALALHHHHHSGSSLLGRAPPLPPLRAPVAATTTTTVSTEQQQLPAARPGTLEYKTLLISNLGSQVSDEDVEDALFHEFKKFGDVSVKLSHTPELGRVAYVNFRHPEDAKEARHAKSSRLALGDRQLKIEPMYVRRRSVTPPPPTDAGGYLPLHAAAAAYPSSYRQRSLSPPGGAGGASSSIRDIRARHYALETLGLSRERERLLDYYGMLDERGRPYGFPPAMPVVEDLKPEDDQRATSNLFIGNLDGNVTEAELRRGFDKYGVIEDVVIKRPARGQGGAYAFVKFQNLDMAHRAKVAMQGRPMGGNPIKIGYGKANPTTRLWVGGLGAGNSLAALAREFDRFGSIRNIDYAKGDGFAYVQYESLDASQAACTQMRGFPLGGPERRLRVDFAKVEESPSSRPFPPGYQPPPALVAASHYDLVGGEAYGRHRSLERELRGVRDRSTPPLPPPPPTSHGLVTQRERDRALLLERDYAAASPTRSLERRAVEAFGRSGRGARSRSRSRERWLKERDELRRGGRRRSRSASTDRPAEEREREKERGRSRVRGPAVAATPDASPDRARVRAPDSTTEPRDHTPENGGGGGGRHSAANEDDAPPPPGRHHHGNKRSGEHLNNHHHRNSEVVAVAAKTAAVKAAVVSVSPADAAASSAPGSGSLSDFAQASLAKSWHGFFALKNSSFPATLYLLEGGAAFFGAVMKDTRQQQQQQSRQQQQQQPGRLKIAQRLRMDQTRLDEVSRRVKLGRPDGYAVLLALQGPIDRGGAAGGGAGPEPPALQARLLRHLVTYLRNKEAAGVVSLPGAKEGGPGAMLYAFPPGVFSQQYLQAAKRTVGNLDEEHMVVVIVNDTN